MSGAKRGDRASTAEVKVEQVDGGGADAQKPPPAKKKKGCVKEKEAKEEKAEEGQPGAARPKRVRIDKKAKGKTEDADAPDGKEGSKEPGEEAEKDDKSIAPPPEIIQLIGNTIESLWNSQPRGPEPVRKAPPQEEYKRPIRSARLKAPANYMNNTKEVDSILKEEGIKEEKEKRAPQEAQWRMRDAI